MKGVPHAQDAPHLTSDMKMQTNETVTSIQMYFIQMFSPLFRHLYSVQIYIHIALYSQSNLAQIQPLKTRTVITHAI